MRSIRSGGAEPRPRHLPKPVHQRRLTGFSPTATVDRPFVQPYGLSRFQYPCEHLLKQSDSDDSCFSCPMRPHNTEGGNRETTRPWGPVSHHCGDLEVRQGTANPDVPRPWIFFACAIDSLICRSATTGIGLLASNHRAESGTAHASRPQSLPWSGRSSNCGLTSTPTSDRALKSRLLAVEELRRAG